MKKEEILNLFGVLAQSQGYYGRLLNSLMSADSDSREEFLSNLEEQNFSDGVDLIMYLES